jgi:hypothetical protein
VELTSSDAPVLAQLRSQPREWHRRGMRHPAELARIGAARTSERLPGRSLRGLHRRTDRLAPMRAANRPASPRASCAAISR